MLCHACIYLNVFFPPSLLCLNRYGSSLLSPRLEKVIGFACWQSSLPWASCPPRASTQASLSLGKGCWDLPRPESCLHCIAGSPVHYDSELDNYGGLCPVRVSRTVHLPRTVMVWIFLFFHHLDRSYQPKSQHDAWTESVLLPLAFGLIPLP